MRKTNVDDFDAFFKRIKEELPERDTQVLFARIENKATQFANTLNDTQMKEFSQLWKLICRYLWLIENEAFSDGALQAFIAEDRLKKSASEQNSGGNNL